ncbi:MAG: hypothetical protein WCE44_06495 [Candidatus Velthaea sp.]|jgi:hypothetical protein
MRPFVLAVFAFALALAPAAAADRKATPSPWLVGRLGISTPEHDALEAIGFRPFVPSRTSKDVALLPPFQGNDTRENRGIGYEYEAGGRLYVLSQWPWGGGSIAGFPALKDSGAGDCRDVHSFPGHPHGIAWTTPRGIVAALRPDGENDANTLLAEWHRLLRRGACR